MKTKALEILIVVTILFVLAFVVGCKDEAEAQSYDFSEEAKLSEPNDYIVSELIVEVQELQRMVGVLIDAGNTQNSCLDKLYNVNTYTIKRVSELEKTVRPVSNFVSIMLSKDIEVNSEKQCDMTVEERLALVRKVFVMMAEQEKEFDPNLFMSRYEIGSICIEGIDEPNEPEVITEGYTFYIWEPDEPQKVSLDFIPTWPDYIELEKDLMFFTPDDNDVCTVGDGEEYIMMPKGTKIYFK